MSCVPCIRVLVVSVEQKLQNCRMLVRPVMTVLRRTKSDDNRDTTASVTSDYGSGCDVTCDTKSRRVNHNHCVLDVTNDVASARTSSHFHYSQSQTVMNTNIYTGWSKKPPTFLTSSLPQMVADFSMIHTN